MYFAVFDNISQNGTGCFFCGVGHYSPVGYIFVYNTLLRVFVSWQVHNLQYDKEIQPGFFLIVCLKISLKLKDALLLQARVGL